MNKELKELKKEYNKLMSKYVDLSYEYEELMLEKINNIHKLNTNKIG